MGSCDVETVLVKIGGKTAEKEERLRRLCAEMAGLSRRSRFLLVHGGGAEVTALSWRLGIEAVFTDGIRQTSPAEMDIVDMVLSGKINKHLARLCTAFGVKAVGISCSDGGVLIGRPAGGEAGSRTGEVEAVDPALLVLLLKAGYLPVISPTSMDRQGLGLNINADSAAFALAASLSADSLVFLSDIPGILRDGEVIRDITAIEAKALIDAGVVTGGMIPKVTASLDAISHGVRNVIIGQYDGEGALAALLDGKRGTRIRR